MGDQEGYQKEHFSVSIKAPLIMAVDCLNESLEASVVERSFPMPPTITQDWVPSGADIKS